VEAARQELRGLLQRLSAIPRDELVYQQKYANVPRILMGLSQLDSQENAILVRQAAEIAKSLPKAKVSATEYYAIAVARQSAYDLQGAKEFLKLATDNATNFADEIASLRMSANLDFLTGEPNADRGVYGQALDIFAKYPVCNNDQFAKGNTNAITELMWSNSEAAIDQLQLALQHVDNAQKLAEAPPQSLGADALKQQASNQRQLLTRTGPSGSPTPLPNPSNLDP